MKSQKYRCIYSDIEYQGQCPTIACPANISKLNKKSGCVYNFLEGKKELDEYDIAYAFNESVDDVKYNVEIGKQRIQNAVLLHNIMSRLRENTRSNFCPQCGLEKLTKGVCLNKKLCDNRKMIAEEVRAKTPYNIPEMKVENKDVFLLVNNLHLIKEFLAQLNGRNDGSLKLYAFLGISKDRVNELKALTVQSK